MTDVRVLELAVIEAARVVSRNAPGGVGPSSNADLRDALAALDAALCPDPWQLLSELVDIANGAPDWDVIEQATHKAIAALEWKEKQNDLA